MDDLVVNAEGQSTGGAVGSGLKAKDGSDNKVTVANPGAGLGSRSHLVTRMPFAGNEEDRGGKKPGEDRGWGRAC